MKLTNRQTSTKTIADLYRSIDRQHCLTITYIGRDGEITVRTIEPHTLRTTSVKVSKTGKVSGGDIVVLAMCRLRDAEIAAKAAAGEDTTKETAEREFHVNRIISYTLHRIGFVLARPEPTEFERPEPAPANDADALFFYELARDRDDADYRPRVRLAA